MIRMMFLFFEIMAVIFCLHGLYGEKIKWNIYTWVFLVVEIAIYMIESVTGAVIWLEIFIHLLFLVYSKLQMKQRWKICVLNYVLCLIISTIVQLICYLPVLIWNNALYDIRSLIVNCLLVVIMFLLYIRGSLRKVSLYLQQDGKIISAIMIFLFALVLFMIFKLNIYKKISVPEWGAVILGGGFLLILLLMLQKERLHNKQITAEKDLNKLYGEALIELIEKVRVNQHNYRNEIATIQGMAYTAKSLDELRAEQETYYNNIMHKDKYSMILSGNNDPIIAGFLYSKLCNMEHERIDINYSLRINRIENIMLTADIVKILGILIDNAMEEVLNYEDRNIEIKLFDNNGLDIEVGNVCKYVQDKEIIDFFKKGFSGKGENRGLGLYSLKTIVKKWHGEISPYNQEINGLNWFYISVHIPDGIG